MASIKASLPRTPKGKTDMAPPQLVKPITPGKGRYDRAPKSSVNRGPAAQALDTFVVPNLIPFAKAATGPADFGARLPYIMSALFLYAREFNPDELQSIFEGVAPDGLDGEDLKECQQLFERTYQEYTHHFMMKVKFYTKKFLESNAGRSWVEDRQQSK